MKKSSDILNQPEQHETELEWQSMTDIAKRKFSFL